MKQRFEYVSINMVSRAHDELENKIVNELMEGFSRPYLATVSEDLLEIIPCIVHSNLSISLYLQCASMGSVLTYGRQLTIINDYRQLLHNQREPKYFAEKKDYIRSYKEICALIDEYQHYQDTGEISSNFFKIFPKFKGKISDPMAENFLLYCREITLRVVEEMTNSVVDQIMRYFPSQASNFIKRTNLTTCFQEVDLSSCLSVESSSKVTFSS